MFQTAFLTVYSGLNLNQYSVASPCLAVLSVLSAASSLCPDLNLIHYNKMIYKEFVFRSTKVESRVVSMSHFQIP